MKQMTRDVQQKPWGLFGRKKTDAARAQDSNRAEKGSKKLFCDPEAFQPCVTVCKPKEGCTCNCDDVRQALNAEIARRGLEITVGDAKTGCVGNCENGPFLGFPQKQFFYLHVTPADVPEIVEETLVHGRILFPFLSVQPERAYRTDIYYERNTGLIAAIDNSVCMVEVAKYFLDFEENLSCGKCVPCRLGMKRMHEGMERIVSGKGNIEDMEQIGVLCNTMIYAALCEFAMTSTRPVLSALNHFREEFLAHIEKQECPAGVCQELVEIQKKKQKMQKRLKKKKK